MASYTHIHSKFLAHKITLSGLGDDAFAKSLATARVDMNPHQVDAALFALQSPLSKGVMLADEVGLGKTIEASLSLPRSGRSKNAGSCWLFQPHFGSSGHKN